MPQRHSFDELTSQAEAWKNLVPIVVSRAGGIREFFEGAEEVVFGGCGSGLGAAFTAATTFQAKTSISSRAEPATEICQSPEGIVGPGTQTVAVLLSRSGQTTEVVHALDQLHSLGIGVLAVTCAASSALATGSDMTIVLTPMTERAVATTRSVTGMILAAQLMAAVVAEDDCFLAELRRLPQVAQGWMARFRELGEQIAQRVDVERYAFVGSGPFYGVALESRLKVEEMVLLPADAYPLLDASHRPQSNVDGRLLVTAFVSDSAYEHEVCILQDTRAHAGVIWALCERADDRLRATVDYVLELDSGLSEWSRAALYLPAVQYMAYYRALARGLNPDEPRSQWYWVDTPG